MEQDFNKELEEKVGKELSIEIDTVIDVMLQTENEKYFYKDWDLYFSSERVGQLQEELTLSIENDDVIIDLKFESGINNGTLLIDYEINVKDVTINKYFKDSTQFALYMKNHRPKEIFLDVYSKDEPYIIINIYSQDGRFRGVYNHQCLLGGNLLNTEWIFEKGMYVKEEVVPVGIDRGIIPIMLDYRF